MFLYFYTSNEDISISDSINDYNYIFESYSNNTPCLSEALEQMIKSTGLSDQKVFDLTNDIISKCEKIVKSNSTLITDKYQNITLKDAKIISSYSCEAEDPNYSPYKILNMNLCSEKREQGIKNVSKYLYIFLRSLRKLDKFYPTQKYMYRCINKYVNLKKNYFNEKIIPYKRGNSKTFYGFTSITPSVNKTLYSNGKKINIKNGTIFDIYGNIWGYDISYFNSSIEDHNILEPEIKCTIMNAIPQTSSQDFIHIRCKVLNNANNENILEGIVPKYEIKLNYKFSDKNVIFDKEKNKYYIKILDKDFVERNKSAFKISYCDLLYELNQYFTIRSGENLELYLINHRDISNYSHMFYDCKSLSKFHYFKIDSNVKNINAMFFGCSSLTVLPDISKWNTSNITDMSHLFDGCSNLISFPDISKWDTSNVKYMNSVFSECQKILSLPNISKWDTSNVVDMNSIFFNCKLLKQLPDISNWNISKVRDINSMFSSCYQLLFLPDISKWETSNINNMRYLFNKCSSLQSLPDISLWNVSNANHFDFMFNGCCILKSLPDISKWDISNVDSISSIFSYCFNLESLPNISKWITSKIKNMENLFFKCLSLQSLPDISNWDTSKVIIMNGMFSSCSSLEYLPDISKWDTSNVHEIKEMFSNCRSLLYIPDISTWNTSNVTNMNYMFYKCSNISVLPDISNWITDSVQEMKYMFSGCTSLITLPEISKWKNTNLKDFTGMFFENLSLSIVSNISNKNHIIYYLYSYDNCINCLNIKKK